jgi:hypothetical protein
LYVIVTSFQRDNNGYTYSAFLSPILVPNNKLLVRQIDMPPQAAHNMTLSTD